MKECVRMCLIDPLVPQTIEYLYISLLHQVLGMELRENVYHINCQHVLVLKPMLVFVKDTSLPRRMNV